VVNGNWSVDKFDLNITYLPTLSVAGRCTASNDEMIGARRIEKNLEASGRGLLEAYTILAFTMKD
jgi:hypothetical protein